MYSVLGCNPNIAYDAPLNPSISHKLGDFFIDNAGRTWMFVLAGAAIAQYDVLGITSAFTAVKLTKALADAGRKIGVAGIALASGQYGWVQVEGPCTINALANTTADTKLYTTATAGYLNHTAAGQTAINGISLTTARGGTDGSAAAYMPVQPFSL